MAVPRGLERADHQGLLPVRLHGALILALLLSAPACSDDPVYIQSVPPALDVSGGNAVDGGVTALELTVPIALPTADDDKKRMDIATQYNLTLDQVPKARRDDTDLELEWALDNGNDRTASASLVVNAANELYRYDSTLIVVGEDEPAALPLAGGRPITVPAGGRATGIIREDQLSEAAQDLDAITRGGFNYAQAILTPSKSKDISGGMGGMLDFIPSAAVPLILDVIVAVDSDAPLHLTATLRVRDRSGRLRPTETDASKLVPASTTLYQPPAAMMTP